MKRVTERMTTLAIETAPTILDFARDCRDLGQVLHAQNVFALLPTAEWQQTKAALRDILGDAFDEAALETAIAEVRQRLRWA